MSKETAMAMATGTPVPTTQPNGAVNATTPETTPSQNTSDPRIQALLKKEVALVNERSAWNKQKQEFESKVKKADEILARAKQFEDTLSKDPVEALKLIGYNETQIFNAMAQASAEKPNKTPEQIAQETTERLLKEKEDKDNRLNEERTKSANEAAVTTSISKLVTDQTNAEKYEQILYNGMPAQELVRETLYQIAAADQAEAKERGEEFVVDEAKANALLAEAADMVEGYFRKQAEGLIGTKFLQKKLEEKGYSKKEAAAIAEAALEPTPSPTTTTANNAAPEPTRTKTLTNRMAPTATSSKVESRSEKRARLERSLATGDKSLLRV